MNIHPTATVAPGARLEGEVTVGPYAYIEPDTVLGDGCVIGPHASVLRHTTLGPGCRVHAGAVLGDLPQDLSFGGAVSYLKVGAKCVIREGVTLHRGTKEGTATEIGDGCFLMATAHCAHNVRLGPGVIVANGAMLGGYAEVGERAFISGNCMIHQFTRVGRLAMLSGGAGISKDVPPFCTVPGIMTNRVVGLNVIGMRRAGLTPEQRLQIKQAFQLVYRSGLNVSQAVERLRAAFAAGPAAEFCAFIEQSKRGICGYGGHSDDDAAE
jgi:UDP-N-acetylglucosamine acyltransferase